MGASLPLLVVAVVASVRFCKRALVRGAAVDDDDVMMMFDE